MMTEKVTAGSLARKFLDALCGGDIKTVDQLLSDKSTWTFRPASLQIPTRTKRELMLQFQQLGGLFTSMTVVSHLKATETTNSIVLHLVVENVVAATGLPDQGEYIFTLECDIERGKITSVTEFSDSVRMHRLFDPRNGEGWKLMRKAYD